MSYGIEHDEEGSAGLRLTARGSVTTCTYRVDTDGRTHLNSVGWKKFLDGKNLRVNRAFCTLNVAESWLDETPRFLLLFLRGTSLPSDQCLG